jgi:hypothetical protein
VPEELAVRFGRQDLKAAFDYSFERSPEEITEYLEGNFKLGPLSLLEESVPVAVTPGSDSGRSGVAAQEEPAEIQPADGGVGRAVSGEVILEEQPSGDEAEALDPKRRRDARQSKPSLMERFAKAGGFQPDGADRFRSSDGTWIARALDGPFPWEQRRPSGELVRCYWVKEHCLDRGPLVIEADVWGLLDQKPDTYAIVLVDVEGDPIEVTGAKLRAMREGETLTLYPAAYRLVVAHEK